MRAPEASKAGGRSVLLLVFLSAALIGGNYVALKEAVRFSTPIALTAVRTGLGALVLLALAKRHGEHFPRGRRPVVGVFLVSLALSTGSSIFLVYGVRRVPAGVAAIMSATMPLVAFVLAAIFVHERPDGRAKVGLAVGIGGVVVLASPAITGTTSPAGIAYLFVAAALWAVGVVLQKAWDFRGISPFMLVGVQLAMSALTVGALTFVLEDGFSGFHLAWGAVVPVFYSAVLAMAIPFALMNDVVRRASTVQAAAVAYLVPFFGVLASWVIRGEGLSAAELVGGVLVVAGVALVNSRRRTPKPSPRRPVASASAGAVDP